ncbi:hypothetical protein Vi05172_g12260 [Venturia inaequalis]|nr:hypothetical protein Vi05172_g12260 [Venturia inaequalis]
MCIFKHIQYEQCECTKRVRVSTCLAAFQHGTRSGRSPSCSAAGDYDLETFTLPGSCGICERQESCNQIFDKLKEKLSITNSARNNATEQLFQYLGDEEPVFTSSYDEYVDQYGRVLVRIFINGIAVQTGRVDEEIAKRVVEQAARLIHQWNETKEWWMAARESADADWCPPAKLNHTCEIETAYSNWFRKCVSAREARDEAEDEYEPWQEEKLRLDRYREAREDMGDPQDSIRSDLPFEEKPQRTTASFPRRPSPLRYEVKAEDVKESNDDVEMVDLVESDSDDDDDDEVCSEIDEMISTYGHFV